MENWHEARAANLGLRVGGLVLLAIGASLAARLHQIALVVSPREATPVTLLLSGGIFLCGSAGAALLFVGPGLWERVEVSERWRRPPVSGPDTPKRR